MSPNKRPRPLWVSRDGGTQPLDSTLRGDLNFPALSPDGKELAYTVDRATWVRDLARGTSLKLVDGEGYPSWTSDGRSISYFGTSYALFLKRADGSAQAQSLLPGHPATETAWSSDGRWLLFRSPGIRELGRRIYRVPVAGDTTVTQLVGTSADALEFSLSPDNKYMAYASDESGRLEVYVVPFPEAGTARWTVSTQGGVEPHWSRTGDEIFYRDLSGNMVSAAVSTKPGFALGKSTHLFAGTAFRTHPGHSEYTVTNDGRRFLMVHPLGKQGMKLVLLRNWARVRAENR